MTADQQPLDLDAIERRVNGLVSTIDELAYVATIDVQKLVAELRAERERRVALEAWVAQAEHLPACISNDSRGDNWSRCDCGRAALLAARGPT